MGELPRSILLYFLKVPLSRGFSNFFLGGPLGSGDRALRWVGNIAVGVGWRSFLVVLVGRNKVDCLEYGIA